MTSCEDVCREFSCEKLTWVADDSRDFVRSEVSFPGVGESQFRIVYSFITLLAVMRFYAENVAFI